MIRLLALSGLALVACEDDVRTERELFLKHFRDYEAAANAKKPAALEALRRLRPRTAVVRDAHRACVAAFGGIERAESEHARAETLLAEVERVSKADPLAAERTLAAAQTEIRRAIDASNAAVAAARGEIDRCMRLVDGLKLGRE